MSTLAIIDTLVRSSKLVRFLPEMENFEVEKRRLLLTPAVYKWVMQEPKKRAAMEYHAKVYAHLKRFVIGDEIDDWTYIKQTRPFEDDIWSLRIYFDPQNRIFGGFAGRDCFIGLLRAERKNLNGVKFKKQITRAKDKWGELFPNQRRLKGTRFSHYVSNGVESDERKTYS